MTELLRSLPQGLLWYPLLLVLAFVLVRAVWSVRFTSRLTTRGPGKPDQLGALARQVERARTEPLARRDLERRLIGLLLQAHGYSGYSMDNCRAFARSQTHSPAAEAVAAHLAETQVAPVRSASGRGVSGAGAAGEVPGDPLYRVSRILDAIEALEAQRGGP